jgi:galactonate dehydratase
VRVESADGAVGWGEASLEGHAEAVEGAIEALRDRFTGHDPRRIEDIWQVAYRGGFYRGGPVLMSALAGLEQALWDLKGKMLGIPAWEMLGGRVRDRVRAYAWIGGDRPDEIGEAAQSRSKQGFTAVKMNATAELDWIGSPRDFDEVALGERLYSRWDFKPFFESGYVDIIQPDLSHAGGLLECRKIAAMAEAYDIAVAPHCPLGPLALASCLQLAACTPNVAIQEVSLGIHYNVGHDLLSFITDAEVLTPVDGFLPIPQKPGLGVTIDEAAVREAHKERHRWRNPVWRYGDGSFAEW